MGARLKARQGHAIGTPQVEDDHVGPLDFALAHDYIEQFLIHDGVPYHDGGDQAPPEKNQRMNSPPFTSQVAPVVK
ncbi:hypothetical protein D3C71_1629770 [compost metagenome]